MTSMPTASVIIAAAGQGRRFLAAEARATERGPLEQQPSKAFVPLAGKPVVAHAVACFAGMPSITEILVAVSPEAREWVEAHADALGADKERRLKIVTGGSDRAESVALALEASDPGTELVAVHDAVRPLIRRAVVEEAMRVAVEHGAAVVGRPVDHTVKRVGEDRRVTETVQRHGLWVAQTPQVFRREILMGAYRRRHEVVGPITDDAQLVGALGFEVMMVLGEAVNLKITTPEDLRICEAVLAAGWPFGPKAS